MTSQKLLPFLLLFYCYTLNGQVYKVDQSIEVIEANTSLDFPWTGGLNSGQYNTMDIDQDGLQDLIVFDRSASKVNVFRNTGSDYEPTFDYSDQFPENLRNWILLRDYDCDGKKDLFASDPLGIIVYKNVSDSDGLKWRIFNERGVQSPLQTQGFSETNLQLNASDIPSITDVDGDGDIDILNFRFTGASTIEFHKNLSMERTGTCDSLQLERITQRWGDFEQCLCEQMVYGDDSCSSFIGGRTQHQAGKSLLTIDLDNDGDHEAIVSEEDCNLLNLLVNEGSVSDAIMLTNSTSFPNDLDPVRLFSFPAAFYEDVDFDGINDLIVAPNVASNIGFSVDFEQSSWFYKNVGSAVNPDFQLIQKDFLQDQMIDVGENAVPAFYDFEGDGDLDLFVGNNINSNLGFAATLIFYENIGNATQPIFELKDPDFFGLSVLNYVNLKPVFEDVDGNGTMDLVLGRTSGNNFSTSIVYFRNNVAFGLELDSQPRELFILSNTVSPENFKFFDIDLDGNKDLLVGRRNGSLEYYRNQGTAESPSFVLEDDQFLGLGISPFTTNTSVDIIDLDGDSNLDLVTADDRGNLNWVTDFRNVIDNDIEFQSVLFQTSVDQSQTTLNLGSRLVVRVANLFNEDKPAIVVGTGQGGINVLRNTGAEIQPIPEPIFGIYPNPAISRNEIVFRTTERVIGFIVSSTGQRITEPQLMEAGMDNRINISGLPDGLYLLVTTKTGSDFTSFRLIIDR
ncbi:MAG: T9SS type A sorting domain-containing protein [Bacteroidota bacterium]